MSTFAFTKLVILQCLTPTEPHTGTKLRDELSSLALSLPNLPPVELIDVSTSTDFLGAIDQLTSESEQTGSSPLLHLEAHGWDDKTGLAMADRTSVDWPELGSSLAKLNQATDFNLHVCVAACYGGLFLGALKPPNACPCFSLIGPTKRIDTLELVETYGAFYKELFVSLDANAAIRALQTLGLDEGGFLVQTAEHWFNKLVRGYLDNDCTKARLLERAQWHKVEFDVLGKTLDETAFFREGVRISKEFPDRAFAGYFMTGALPSNVGRFASVLSEINNYASAFFVKEGL